MAAQRIDIGVNKVGRDAIGNTLGHWFEHVDADPDRRKITTLIRIRYQRRIRPGWIATIMEAQQIYFARSKISALGRNVLGIYPTCGEAWQAAKTLLGIGDDRLCTPRDIDAVRRELAKGPR